MFEFSEGLKSRGFDVTVLTALPNYPTGKIFDEFQGLKESWDKENQILRTSIKPSRKKSAVRRLYTYLTFLYSATSGNKKHFKRGEFDIVFASSPPLFAALAGVDIARYHKAKFVFDIRDLWPDIAASMGMMNKFSLPYFWLDSIHYRIISAADFVSVTTETDVELIKSKGYPENQIAFIPNGANTNTFFRIPDVEIKNERNRLGLSDKFVICYSGSLNQGMNEVNSFVPLMEKLRNHQDITLLLVGDGENLGEIKSNAKAKNLESIRFIPKMDLASLNGVLNACDAGIVPRKRLLKNNSGGYPVKMFENWAVENPVILGADSNTEERKILERANAGIAADPGDIDSIADAVLKLKSDNDLCTQCGVNGRIEVVESFSRQASTDKLCDVFRSILK